MTTASKDITAIRSSLLAKVRASANASPKTRTTVVSVDVPTITKSQRAALARKARKASAGKVYPIVRLD